MNKMDPEEDALDKIHVLMVKLGELGTRSLRRDRHRIEEWEHFLECLEQAYDAVEKIKDHAYRV